MDKVLECYLQETRKYLKRIPEPGRTDIIKEIESEIYELQNAGGTPGEITNRLGNPKDLAKAYITGLLEEEKGFSFKKFMAVCAFYSAAGLSGMFVIPVLGIIAPVFIAMGAVIPVLAFIKMADYIFNIGIPYMENVKVVLNGAEEANPVAGFLIAVVIGILLYLAGKGAWKLLVLYCKKTANIKRSISA